MLNVLFFFCFSALVATSIPLWKNTCKQKRSTGALLEQREFAESPLGFIDVILMFFFWMLGQAVSIGLISLLFGIPIEELPSATGNMKSWAAILMAASQLVATLMAIGVFVLRYRLLSVVGWQPKNLRRDLLIGLSAFVMVVPGILFFQWLLVLVFAYEHPTMELLSKNANGLTLIATWFSAVIVAPICEEVFFRGILQSWLQRLGGGTSDFVLIGGWDSQSQQSPAESRQPIESPRKTIATRINEVVSPYASPSSEYETNSRAILNDNWSAMAVWPIVVTSALFGLAHAGQGPAPISLFFFGIALGYIYRKTGSVVPCIVLHMLLNGFSMFWFTLQVFLGETEMVSVLERLPSAAHATWFYLM